MDEQAIAHAVIAIFVIYAMYKIVTDDDVEDI